MNDYVIHPTTKSSLEQLLAKPGHAYLFWGARGLGKTTLAQHVASQLIGNQSEGDQARWILSVMRAPDKKNIGIAQLKTVNEFLYQKLPEGVLKKVVVIDEAETLSIEAANSLLKILEEPPNDSVLILTAHNTSALPITIRSRLSSVEFKRPKTTDVIKLIGDNPEAKQLLDIYGAKPALIAQLKADEASYKQSVSLYADAKEFFIAALDRKLVIATGVTKDQNEARFIEFLSGFVTSDPTASEALIFADKHLYNSGNSRFVLEHLALELA